MDSAELFDIQYYKIVYSEELIPYSLAIPSSNFAVGYSLGDYLCFQSCPIEEIKNINSDYNYEITGHDIVVWRPLVPDDEGDTAGIWQDIRLATCDISRFYDGYYWCLIPCKLDPLTGELVEDLTLLYPRK